MGRGSGASDITAARSWTAAAGRHRHHDRSDELEKLLGAPLGDRQEPGKLVYNAETMVDELLASTWAPSPPSDSTCEDKSIDVSSPRRVEASSQTRRASFTLQTSSMSALQAVLSDSIERLVEHRKVVSDRIAELEQGSRKAISQYQEGLAHPELLLNQICTQMEDLEERFTKVSSTAVVVGDKLSTLDDERTRVLETDEMMEALLALNDPSNAQTKSSSALFNTLHNPAQLHEASRIIKKMHMFSSELSSPEIAHAVSEIERLSQTIENSLLNEFSSEQEEANVAGMRKCAESLIEYNDKEKVADRYVWNVMSKRLSQTREHATGTSLDSINGLSMLLTKIATICKEEFPVIDSVFPTSACQSSRELLVERLFNDPVFGVSSYLEHILSTSNHQAIHGNQMLDGSSLWPPQTPASPASTEPVDVNQEYVRILCTAYEKACAAASAIEAIEYSRQNKSREVPAASGQKNSMHHDADVEDKALAADHGRMHIFLGLQLHSLFGSHLDKYFRVELDFLQAQLKDIAASVKFPQLPVAKPKSGAKLRDARVSSFNAEKDGAITQSEASQTFYEGLLLLAQDEDVPEKLVDAMKESVERCGVILKESDLRGELVTKMFSSLAMSYGDEYLGKILSTAKETLHEARVGPQSEIQFFVIMEAVLERIEFFEDQFEAIIVPAQTDRPTQLTICHESARKCLEKLEKSIAAGLQQLLLVAERTMAHLLTTNQEKADFIGGQGNMSLSCSKACQKGTEYLEPLVSATCRVLVGENCERFLIALCTAFKEVYLQHLRKYRFDPDGACTLLRDVSEYRLAFRSTTHPTAIDDVFDLLHDIANVFALQPENLGGFVHEGKLATMSKQTLLSIIKRRVDYKLNAEKISASLKDEQKLGD